MQNVGRNVTVKGGSDGVSGRNEEHVLLGHVSGENAVLAIRELGQTIFMFWCFVESRTCD